ncbi:MAG: cation:proton antiporter [Chlamydiota bacterium]
MFENLTQVLNNHFFNLLFIMVIIWSLGLAFEKINFPLIIGQLLAGIIIGPAVLNIVENTPEIETLSQLGMFFLMFYAGLNTDPKKMRNLIPSSSLIGLMGTAFPFLLGYLVIKYDGGSTLEALFIATAISGTSLVTKTHILESFKLLQSSIGHSMISSAIIDNIVSFIILAILVKFVQTNEMSLGSGLVTSLEVIIFFAITLFIGYAIFPKLSKLFDSDKGRGFTFALIMGLLFAVLAVMLHLPFILGAYLAGLFVREEVVNRTVFKKLNNRMVAITHGFLGPIFIMSVAFKVSFDVLVTHPFYVLLVVLAAFIGKFAGIFLGARLTGFDRQDSLIMGVGMNGRGAVELVFANVGVTLGVLNYQHLSLLVFVAFLTTFSAPLLLNAILRKNLAN